MTADLGSLAADPPPFELPLGATPSDTGEFLLGRVAVTPVFFQSDGRVDSQSQQWSAEEIDAVLANVTEGFDWWSRALDRLDTVHELEFVYDTSFATDPFETRFEPIDRPSSDFNLYVSEFLAEQGQRGAPSIEFAISQFNHSQRLKLETDWSITVFIVDSSDDDNGFFNSGGFAGAFAFAGGQFVVSPSTRPASTFAHEFGHLFWARDEYPGGGSYTDQRGYYNTQNLNAADNPAPGFVAQDSILRAGGPLQRAYESETSPASTFAFVGWQDSDGDGIFDVLDVPLDLDVNGELVQEDDDRWRIDVTGSAAAVALQNQNSSGNQSDITLNRVDAIEARIGDGDWFDVVTPRTRTADLDFSISLPIGWTPADGLELRAVDRTVGVTSEIRRIDSSSGRLASPGDVAGQLAWASLLDGDEFPDAGIQSVRLLGGDGSPLRSTRFDSRDFADRIDGDNVPVGEGLQFAVNVDGESLQPGVLESRFVPDLPVLAGFDFSQFRWRTQLSGDTSAVVQFDQPSARVAVEIVGRQGAFARVEAFDADGNLVVRQTAGVSATGEIVSIEVESLAGDIASVVLTGHADTVVELVSVASGDDFSIVADDDGQFLFSGVAADNYQLEIIAENPIYDFGPPIDVSLGLNEPLILPGLVPTRIDSLLFNGALPVDVNGDGAVEPIDALLIVNRLRRGGDGFVDRANADPSMLSAGQSMVDVTNDGLVTPLDVLLVVNQLRRGQAEFSGEAAVTASRPGQSIDESISPQPAALAPDRVADRIFEELLQNDQLLAVHTVSVDFEAPIALGASNRSESVDSNGDTTPSIQDSTLHSNFNPVIETLYGLSDSEMEL